MKNAALAIAGCVASVIGFIERCCWLNSPGIAMLAVLVAFLISFDSYPNVAVLLAPCSRIFLIMSHGRVVLRTAVALFLSGAIVTALKSTTGLHLWTMAS